MADGRGSNPTEAAMATTQLKREPNIGVANPDWPDIRSTMSNIVSDGDEQSLTLQHSSAGNPSELLIIRVNDDQTGEPVGWLVHYIPSSGRESRVLTNSGELAPRTAREFFGAVVDIPESCLVTEDAIQAAATHFLQHGDPNPSQTWVDYFTAINHH
jgi:hypothetical protein